MGQSFGTVLVFFFMAAIISCGILLRLSKAIKDKDFDKSAAILKQLVFQIFICLSGILAYLFFKY